MRFLVFIAAVILSFLPTSEASQKGGMVLPSELAGKWVYNNNVHILIKVDGNNADFWITESYGREYFQPMLMYRVSFDGSHYVGKYWVYRRDGSIGKGPNDVELRLKWKFPPNVFLLWSSQFDGSPSEGSSTEYQRDG